MWASGHGLVLCWGRWVHAPRGLEVACSQSPATLEVPFLAGVPAEALLAAFLFQAWAVTLRYYAVLLVGWRTLPQSASCVTRFSRHADPSQMIRMPAGRCC